MTRFMAAGAAMLSFFASSQAGATDYLVDFTIAPPSWTYDHVGQPFGLPPEPAFTGSAVVDNTQTDGRSFLALDWVTGTKTWKLSDIDLFGSSVRFNSSGAFVQFGLMFKDGWNYIYTNNTVRVRDVSDRSIVCNGCVTVNSVSVVTSVSSAPEPGAWTLMLIGVGGVGWALRTRRRRLTSAALDGA